MTITIQAGWWLLPLAVTLASFVWAFWPPRHGGSGYGEAVVGMFCLAVATIVSLLGWLIWSLAA